MNRLDTLEKGHYDPRWFIWTIVFLIVSGVSLASYIFITSSDDVNAQFFFPSKSATVQAVSPAEVQTQPDTK